MSEIAVPDEHALSWKWRVMRVRDGASDVVAHEEARRAIAKIKADAVREAADHLDALQTPHEGYPRDVGLALHDHADKIEEDSR